MGGTSVPTLFAPVAAIGPNSVGTEVPPAAPSHKSRTASGPDALQQTPQHPQSAPATRNRAGGHGHTAATDAG
ncbi:DUF6053 domain-containing protein [Lysobacter enzymogenes]|uniref:DUF6053 domain-containing protein n=1 Tax=Lysobacter enzymogenes TaxID=69 RepID=UPI00384FCE9A